MRKVLTVVALCSGGFLLFHAFAQAPVSSSEEQQKFRLAVPGQPIAGIPFEEALEIYKRHEEELRTLPGAVSVSFTADGLLVETANPSAVPDAVEGLPVIPALPVDPRAAGGLVGATTSPPTEVKPIPLPDRPEPVHPELQPCPSGMFRAPGEGRCRYINPPDTSPAAPDPQFLSPPDGVVVLKPGKVREQAAACPKGFKEVEGYGGWRFCVDPFNPEKIPPLWSPPIAGIPYEEVLEIYDRHWEALAKLPGIEGVGLRTDGIHIHTAHPEAVPKEVEGLPIIVHPATGRKIKLLNHTFNSPVHPLHGGVFISQDPQESGVLTGMALSQGTPLAHLSFVPYIRALKSKDFSSSLVLVFSATQHSVAGTAPISSVGF